MKKASIGIILALAMVLTSVIGSVSTVSATDPLNFGGHYYQIYNSSGITWQQANAAASALTIEVGGLPYQGHLVAITSAEENAFVYSQLVAPGRAWIGASQLSDQTSVLAGWGWVTGESMSYTNWDINAPDSPAPGSPNDAGGISGNPYYHFEDNAENYMEMRGHGYWDDVANSVEWVNDYVVEFEPAYDFGGFLPPLVINGAGNGLFKAGSTIPVKFQITDNAGNMVSTATGTASINTSPAASTAIRYDATAMQYIGNLKTPKGVTGSYTIAVTLGDGSVYTIGVTLR